MEFSGQYLTRSEYIALGGSSTITETSFNLLEYEARKQIDLRTKRRLIGLSAIPKEVKMCDYHLIDKIIGYSESMQNASDNNIVQESIDGYSVTYVSPSEISNILVSKNSEFQDIMLDDLYGVIVNGEHIIYNGD